MVIWIIVAAIAALQTAPGSQDATAAGKPSQAAIAPNRSQPDHPVPFKRAVQPLTSPRTWVTGNDYPIEAIRSHQTGTVGFRLSVDAQGIPVECVITVPVSPVLDAETCRLMLARARFKPALDGNSRPAPATFTSRFSWELPEGNAPIMTAWSQTSKFVVGSAGKILSCDSRLKGEIHASSFCYHLQQEGLPGLLARLVDSATDQKPMLLVLELGMNFDGRPKVEPGYLSSSLRRRWLTRVSFETSESGELKACSQVENSGDGVMPMPLCDIVTKIFETNKLAPPLQDKGTGWASVSTGQPD